MQTQLSHEALERTLIRWEGAVSRCERDGDDSDEAVKELADSRQALLDLLKLALAGIP